MKILVTGAAGQLGSDLVALLRSTQHEVIAATRKEIDLTQPDRVAHYLRTHCADWVINCAAYTQVDKAEAEPLVAHKVNAVSVRSMAQTVRAYDGRMVHVSTDFVFDGTQAMPYSETDTPHPSSVYGQTKREGEQVFIDSQVAGFMLRTAWVYGVQGANFVKTIVRLLGERDQLRVVDDQLGSPSWSADIASAIMALVQRDASGVYHYTNEGVASWYDFAIEIQRLGVTLGLVAPGCEILPIPTTQYPTPAQRPANSVLSKIKVRAELDRPIPHWRDSLQKMMKELAGA